MTAYESLKKRSEIDRVFKTGRRVKTELLVLVATRSYIKDEARVRFAFQVKRSFGSSVKRNKIRRRLKEAAKVLSRRAKGKSCDIVVIVLKRAKDFGYKDLEKDLEKALKRLRCIS